MVVDRILDLLYCIINWRRSQSTALHYSKQLSLCKVMQRPRRERDEKTLNESVHPPCLPDFGGSLFIFIHWSAGLRPVGFLIQSRKTQPYGLMISTRVAKKARKDERMDTFKVKVTMDTFCLSQYLPRDRGYSYNGGRLC